MSTELPQNEIRLFHAYLGRRLESGEASVSPEQSVKEFREYCAEVERFIAETQASIASGPAKPLDHDAVMDRVLKRLSAEDTE